jgi:hypothetical protein
MEEAIKVLEEKMKFHEGVFATCIKDAGSHEQSVRDCLDQAEKQKAKAAAYRAALEKLKA